MIFGLQAVALFEMPHPVILPGAGVFRIGGKRFLVPDLGVVGAAELAAREADQVGDIGMLIMAERLQYGDAAGIIVLFVDEGISLLVAVAKFAFGLLVRCRLRIGWLRV